MLSWNLVISRQYQKNVYQYIEKKNGKSYFEQTALHANNLQNPFFSQIDWQN